MGLVPLTPVQQFGLALGILRDACEQAERQGIPPTVLAEVLLGSSLATLMDAVREDHLNADAVRLLFERAVWGLQATLTSSEHRLILHGVLGALQAKQDP